MSFLANTKNIKKIVLLLLFVILFNFTVPLISMAADDEEDESTVGGKLFRPVGELLCTIGDTLIILMQDVFLGNKQIEYTVEDGITTFFIQYSPGAIFSNKIPGLNINFFNPPKDYKVTLPSQWKSVEKVTSGFTKGNRKMEDALIEEALNNVSASYGFSTDIAYSSAYTKNEGDVMGVWYNGEVEYRRYTWENKGKEYLLAITVSDNEFCEAFYNISGILNGTSANSAIGDLATALGLPNLQDILDTLLLVTNPVTQATKAFDMLYEEGMFQEVNYYVYERTAPYQTGEKIKATSGLLQEKISSWYNVLRTLALVGLLSVLLYIGIRVVTSSTGEAKAKYKKMIFNWVIAICLLFLMHYLMNFIITMTETLIDLFVDSAVDPSGRDPLMSDIREEIFDGRDTDFFNIFAYVVIYLTLVIFTILFTWRYLKRVVYIAFLTLIAPLVALVYPLDKLRNNNSNTFSIWLREYIFTSLIQVVHLLVYSIFVGSGRDLLINKNPLFALVAIGFMLPSEGIIKKLFGFEGSGVYEGMSKTNGGNALVSALNKIYSKNITKTSRTKNNSNAKSDASTPRYASMPDIYTSADNYQSNNDSKSTNLSSHNYYSKHNNNSDLNNNFVANSTSKFNRAYIDNNNSESNENNNNNNIESNNYIRYKNNNLPNNYLTDNYISSTNNNSEQNLGSNLNSYLRDEYNYTPNNYSEPNFDSVVKNSTNILNRTTPTQEDFNTTTQHTKRNIKSTIKNMMGKYLKKSGKSLKQLAIGALGASITTPISLAAGLSTGDLEQTLSAGLTAIKAGYSKANTITDNAIEFISETKEAFEKSNPEIDESTIKNSFAELNNDIKFNKSCKNLGIKNKKQKENLIRNFHKNGITDADNIKKLMNIREKTKATEKELFIANKIKQHIKFYGITEEEIRKILKDKGLNKKDEIDRAIYLIKSI